MGSYVIIYVKQIYAYYINLIRHISLKFSKYIGPDVIKTNVELKLWWRHYVSRDKGLKVHSLELHIYRIEHVIELKFGMCLDRDVL